MNRIIRLVKSFKYAFKGIYYSLREEQNMKVHFVMAGIVIILAIYFKISMFETISLALSIAFVIAMELFNTILERVMDIIKPRMHPYAKHVKDMMAATVLIAAVTSVIIGLVIFLPKTLELFS